ncbi:MAG: M23 family metallopeptidase [Clostridia bacterium]|nr:M23 family metallopeptidase [Clostridia bacterium]
MYLEWGKNLKRKRAVIALLAALLIIAAFFNIASGMFRRHVETGGRLLKWVDFNVTSAAMNDALKYDVDSQGSGHEIHWIDLLACLGARYGGNFSCYKKSHMESIVSRLREGESIDDITASMKYFEYYSVAYESVLGGLVGEYYAQTGTASSGAPEFERRYGLKAFSPIARGWGFSHSDDFGASRAFGYRRRHLGHDMFGSVGTPVINVETCVVQVLGWNRYGGWRIGMRSLDGRRYYYYAHLRSGHPYAAGLKEGQTVYAGEVIGYLGMTGYSDSEDYNGMQRPHLHFGVQLIFDESSSAEIWIDPYELIKFLGGHRSATVSAGGGEFKSETLCYDLIE